MTQDNPVTGRPFDGRNEKPDDDVLPGERPAREDEQTVGPPAQGQREGDSGSRAAEDGPMTSRDGDKLQPGPGMHSPPDSPDPSGATDADPPGGSVANQSGRAPDQ